MLINQKITQSVVEGYNPSLVYYNTIDEEWDTLGKEDDDITGLTLGIAVLDIDSQYTMTATIYEKNDSLDVSDGEILYEKDIIFNTSNYINANDVIEIIGEEGVESTVNVSGIVQSKNISFYPSSNIKIGKIPLGQTKEFPKAIKIENSTLPNPISLYINDITFPTGIKARWSDQGGDYSTVLTGRNTNTFISGESTEVLPNGDGVEWIVNDNILIKDSYSYGFVIYDKDDSHQSNECYIVKTNNEQPLENYNVLVGETNKEKSNYIQIIGDIIVILFFDAENSDNLYAKTYDLDLNLLDTEHIVLHNDEEVTDLGNNSYASLNNEVIFGSIYGYETQTFDVLLLSVTNGIITYNTIDSEFGDYDYFRNPIIIKITDNIYSVLVNNVVTFFPSLNNRLFLKTYRVNISTLNVVSSTQTYEYDCYNLNLGNDVIFSDIDFIYSYDTDKVICSGTTRKLNTEDKGVYSIEIDCDDTYSIIDKGYIIQTEYDNMGFIKIDETTYLNIVQQEMNFLMKQYEYNTSYNNIVYVMDLYIDFESMMEYTGGAYGFETKSLAIGYSNKTSMGSSSPLYVVKFSGGDDLYIDLKAYSNTQGNFSETITVTIGEEE